MSDSLFLCIFRWDLFTSKDRTCDYGNTDQEYKKALLFRLHVNKNHDEEQE